MWIYPYPRKSVDMDVDIDEKYHVHGYSYVKRMRGCTSVGTGLCLYCVCMRIFFSSLIVISLREFRSAVLRTRLRPTVITENDISKEEKSLPSWAIDSEISSMRRFSVTVSGAEASSWRHFAPIYHR